MALRGYVCPRDTPTNEWQAPGQRNTIEHCLGKCRNPCVSPVLLAKMWDTERRNHHTGTYISSSMLASEGCARQVWFERQPDVEVYETPRRRYWPFRGTIIHGLIEGAAPVVLPYGWLQELRLSVDLVYPDQPAPIFDANGVFTGAFDTTKPLTITVGGTTDAVNPYIRELHDHKSTGDLKLQRYLSGKQGGTFCRSVPDTFVWQTNIYGWLLSKTEISEDIRRQLREAGCRDIRQRTFPSPRRIRIQLLTMMEIPITGTAYTPLRTDISYDMEEVPVLPHWKVEAFVREHAYNWYRWLVLGEKPPIQPKKWQCDNCPFNAHIHSEGLCYPETEGSSLQDDPNGGTTL